MRRCLLRSWVCALLWLFAGGALAQAYRWAPDAKEALQRLDRAADQLQKARAAAAAIDAGQQPPEPAQGWPTAPADLVAAVEAFDSSEGVNAPEEPGPFPLQQLRACATRAAALEALGKRQKTLSSTAQRGLEAAGHLRARLVAAAGLEEARRELVAFGNKHGREPAQAALFPWQWPLLDGPLQKALGAYLAALRRQQALIEASAGQLRALAAEAASQAAAFAGRTSDCALAGSWAGTMNLAGAISGVGMQLSQTGEAWTGAVTLNGASVPVTSLHLSGGSVSVSLRDGRGTLAGALSADGRILSGTFSSSEGPATFELRKSR